MSRRSPFQSSQFGKSLAQSQPEPQATTQHSESGFAGDSHLQGIPTTEKKARNRAWEKEHKVCGYWGIPVALRDACSAIAAQVGVKVDDIVRAFFEYGLDEFNAGRIQFTPVPNPHGRGKMTLYPDASGWGQKGGWRREAWDPKPRQVTHSSKAKKMRKKSSLDKQEKETCTLVIRDLPGELHQAIQSVADRAAVPTGQIAITFLNAGLTAFRSGELVLEPVAATKEKTLYP